MDRPYTFKEWLDAEIGYPSKGVLYGWTRPGKTRDELMRAGVIARVNGRWLFNPARWRAYCEQAAAA